MVETENNRGSESRRALLFYYGVVLLWLEVWHIRAEDTERLGVVFNSRVYQVADYLQKKNLKLDALVGYDLLQKNVEHLKNGEVNYLIGQRPGLQGYCGIKALCNHVVFKKPVTAVKYMPIDILMKENIDFYFEFE